MNHKTKFLSKILTFAIILVFFGFLFSKSVKFTANATIGKEFTLDSVLGYTTKGSLQLSVIDTDKILIGSNFWLSENARAFNITVYLTQYYGHFPIMQFALYDTSSKVLLASTNSWTMTEGFDGWKTLSLTTNPIIQKNKNYTIAVFSPSYFVMFYELSSSRKNYQNNLASLPSTANWTISSGMFSLYLGYRSLQDEDLKIMNDVDFNFARQININGTVTDQDTTVMQNISSWKYLRLNSSSYGNNAFGFHFRVTITLTWTNNTNSLRFLFYPTGYGSKYFGFFIDWITPFSWKCYTFMDGYSGGITYGNSFQIFGGDFETWYYDTGNPNIRGIIYKPVNESFYYYYFDLYVIYHYISYSFPETQDYATAYLEAHEYNDTFLGYSVINRYQVAWFDSYYGLTENAMIWLYAYYVNGYVNTISFYNLLFYRYVGFILTTTPNYDSFSNDYYLTLSQNVTYSLNINITIVQIYNNESAFLGDLEIDATSWFKDIDTTESANYVFKSTDTNNLISGSFVFQVQTPQVTVINESFTVYRKIHLIMSITYNMFNSTYSIQEVEFGTLDLMIIQTAYFTYFYPSYDIVSGYDFLNLIFFGFVPFSVIGLGLYRRLKQNALFIGLWITTIIIMTLWFMFGIVVIPWYAVTILTGVDVFWTYKKLSRSTEGRI